MKWFVGRTAVLAILASLALLLIAKSTWATPGTGITSTNLAVGRIGPMDVKSKVGDHEVKIKSKGESDVYVVHNRIAPGGHTGWHSHPGPSLITVKSGAVTNYHSDDPSCTPHVYTAGMTFIDPGGDHSHILRNEGAVEAETIAFQILPDGATRRIDMPDPGHCPF